MKFLLVGCLMESHRFHPSLIVGEAECGAGLVVKPVRCLCCFLFALQPFKENYGSRIACNVESNNDSG